VSKYPLTKALGVTVMEEIGFKPVPGCPGYFANKDGDILTFKIHKQVRKCKSPKHYPRFSVTKNGRKTTVGIHQAVALAFLGPCPPGMEVAHMDGNRHNPKLENLKYVTRKENHSHMLIHGTAQRGEGHPGSKLTAAEVKEIRKCYWFDGKNKGNAGDLAAKFGVSKSTIHNVAKGKKWKHI
jgi:hypothetical protein